MKSVRSLSNLLEAIGISSPKRQLSAEQAQCVEDDMRVQASMSKRSAARELAKGDRVSALVGRSTAPRARSNSLNLMGPECPRGMVRSGSFDPRTLPSVSLNFLKDSSPASHATEWPANTIADQPRTYRNAPPMSSTRQAAIDRCIAAIADCTSVLAQSTKDATDQAQSCSPRAAENVRAFQAYIPAYIPRAGYAPDASVGAASEDILRWIDGTPGGCESPAYCTQPPAALSPDAFAKSPLRAPDAFDKMAPDAFRKAPRQAQGELAQGALQPAVCRAGGAS